MRVCRQCHHRCQTPNGRCLELVTLNNVKAVLPNGHEKIFSTLRNTCGCSFEDHREAKGDVDIQEIRVILGYMEKLSQEQRKHLFAEARVIWCGSCGRHQIDGLCQCFNDE